uniref:Integrase catalytic domain-containing protein n=1 Tax=Nicotiana tabacum TaxID=4097 RepID=A0A1S3WZG7_TOBAC|nr:PREDICTED: uncharacterized protein LOC107759485 [Nicotiana tabacum]
MAPPSEMLGPNQTRRVLKEVHEGHCESHSDNRALVRCLIRAGYYWPTMKKEATDFVKTSGAFAQIREQEVIAFIWKNIICRFGLPKEISCDIGPQFAGKKVADSFEKWHIKRILSTPYHPVGNGQAESSNKSILNIMKKKLEDAKGMWSKILPEVL